MVTENNVNVVRSLDVKGADVYGMQTTDKQRRLSVIYAYQDGSQNIPHQTNTYLDMDIVKNDTDGGYDLQNNDYEIPFDGIWLFVGTLRMINAADGSSATLRIEVNGNPVAKTIGQWGSSAGNQWQTIAFGEFDKGDIVDTVVYYNGGDGTDADTQANAPGDVNLMGKGIV